MCTLPKQRQNCGKEHKGTHVFLQCQHYDNACCFLLQGPSHGNWGHLILIWDRSGRSVSLLLIHILQQGLYEELLWNEKESPWFAILSPMRCIFFSMGIVEEPAVTQVDQMPAQSGPRWNLFIALQWEQQGGAFGTKRNRTQREVVDIPKFSVPGQF